MITKEKTFIGIHIKLEKAFIQFSIKAFFS